LAARLLSDCAKISLFSGNRPRRAAAAAAAGTALLLTLGVTPARAQATTPGVARAQAPPTGEVLKLTAEEVVQMARENNPDIAAAGYDPRIGAERVAEARAAFLPTLQSGVNRNVQQSPPTSVFFGTSGVRTDVWSGNVGVGQQLPWGGGTYNIAWTSDRTNATSTLSNFNPAVTAQLQ